MKKLVVISLMIALISSCDRSDYNDDGTGNKPIYTTAPSYDPHRGEGKFTNVELGKSLDVSKAEIGFQIYSVKCIGCHKLTDEKLVGPGWTGITTRHSPEWIMNFITNTDDMLTKDPNAVAMLQICLVRMPNQDLSDDDARNILEFMRKNDGVK